MNADDIAGYTYQGDMYCPPCTIAVLPTGDGEAFDGWGLAAGWIGVESNLDELAYAFGFNRADETTFDSSDFPKVIFHSQLAAADEFGVTECSNCGVEL